MSGFLSHITAKSQSALPTLSPRVPAPFEDMRAQGEDFGRAQVEVNIAQPNISPNGPPSAAPFAASPNPSAASIAPIPTPGTPAAIAQQPAPVAPPFSHATPSASGATRVQSALGSPVSVAAPMAASPQSAPATVMRRMRGAHSPTAAAPVPAPARAPAVTSAPRATPSAPPLRTPDTPSAPIAPTRPVLETRADTPAPAEPTPASPSPVINTPVAQAPAFAPVQDAPPVLTDVAAPLAPHQRPERAAPAPLLPNTAPPRRAASHVPNADAPIIDVQIGTIDVVFDAPPPAPPAPSAQPAHGISLDDFLDGQEGARR